MPSPALKGKHAEDLAANYLAGLGFAIIRRNVRLAGGELDIVAVENDILVFVEVKAGLSRDLRQCLEAVTQDKMRRLTQAAQAFEAQNAMNLPCRFDVVTVDLATRPPACTLWRDAFRP